MIELAAIFLNILLPVFSLVLIGYLAGPRLGMEPRTLSKLAYYILAPAFIFNIFSKAEVQLELAVRMALYAIVVTLGGVAVAFVMARLLGAGPQMVAAYVLVAGFGNVGNFGLPIVEFKVGSVGMLPASIYFLTGSTFGFLIGVMAATWQRGGAHWKSVWAAFTTPGVIAVLPAFLVNWLHLPTPMFVDRAVALMAGALIPIMLLTLGVQLAGMGRPRIDRHVVAASVARLLITPVLAIALAGVFAITGIERSVGIMQAAMPAAVLTSLIALEHDLIPDFVTTVVLFSTVASAVTLTIVLAIV
ncbi:MAG: AEC family transporter [Caldilinea sp.]|mgnify:CR=1 FL=1|uniref:AEC family transporter n=1 Tax=Caldilinea sp. TaxID=2293560 RepID=UPI002B6639A1|nr:AEC family transporter [Anaerolineales bacterium]HQY91775.1 AEC family transporter [Caldilinea sp.]HRA64423.1 AEC family transporter [Caldilinea sp.]